MGCADEIDRGTDAKEQVGVNAPFREGLPRQVGMPSSSFDKPPSDSRGNCRVMLFAGTEASCRLSTRSPRWIRRFQ